MRGTLVNMLSWVYGTHQAASRQARRLVAIEFPEHVVDATQEWSPAVQVRFAKQDGRWAMQIRSAEAIQAQQAQAAREQSIAARAARQ